MNDPIRADSEILGTIKKPDSYWGNVIFNFHWVEWEPNFEVGGEWYLYAQIATEVNRKSWLIVNGKRFDKPIMTEVTGGYHRNQAKWFRYGPYAFKEGKNVIRIEGDCDKCNPPHIGAIYFSRSDSSDPPNK